jgi:hypothetical protein
MVSSAGNITNTATQWTLHKWHTKGMACYLFTPRRRRNSNSFKKNPPLREVWFIWIICNYIADSAHCTSISFYHNNCSAWTWLTIFLEWSLLRKTREDIYIYIYTHTQCNIEVRLRNILAVKKPCVEYSERVSVALVIQHARHMCRITSMLSSVTSLALKHFSTLSHKRYDFGKELLNIKLCVLILSTSFIWNISRYLKNSAKYDKKKCTSVYM